MKVILREGELGELESNDGVEDLHWSDWKENERSQEKGDEEESCRSCNGLGEI